MFFRETPIFGAWEILLERHEDERGFFARTWCARDFEHRGLPGHFVQANVSYNPTCGTLRGLHFQLPPSAEGKLVRCELGAVYDVIVDPRPESPTYLQHFAVELDAARGNALYIPPCVAHGFQTLDDGVRVGYLMSDVHAPELAAGLRWNDPAFGIEWPLPVTLISERDRSYPDFEQARHEALFQGALER